MKNILNMENKKLGIVFDIVIISIIFIFLLGIVNTAITIIINMFMPSQITPTDMSFMLIPYLGIPFVFWISVGIGFMFGLIFHGFQLISVNSDSHNKTFKRK